MIKVQGSYCFRNVRRAWAVHFIYSTGSGVRHHFVNTMQSCGCRYFSTTYSVCKEVAKNLKGKSKSSQDWLVRQLKDPYVEKAKRSNFRCRSAFKLIEINDKFQILGPGDCVVDIGAAPGSWSQVAVDKTNALGKDKEKPRGFVVGLDRLHLYPVEGASLLGGCDFTHPIAVPRLLELLDNRRVTVILSDMAPNATGVKTMDHDAIISLANKVFNFSLLVSSPGATILIKVWEGRSCAKLEKDLSQHYESVRWVKPKSSRSDSSEIFILGRNFKSNTS